MQSTAKHPNDPTNSMYVAYNKKCHSETKISSQRGRENKGPHITLKVRCEVNKTF